MKDLKAMYRTLLRDEFPESLSIELGGQRLVYKKRNWTIDGEAKGLRYGENPDQPAALYALAEGTLQIGGLTFRNSGQGLVSALTEAQMLQTGKHPGKTNLTDVDSGVNILQYLHERPAVAILKHNNPCGAAWASALPKEEGGGLESVARVLEKAFWCDRIAAFGGAVVFNRPVSKEAAEIIDGAYFEVVAAPDFEPGVFDILKKRKNLRIFHLPGLGRLEELSKTPFLDIHSLADGGLVLQQSFMNRIRRVEDFIPASAEKDGLVVTARAPSKDEAEDLLFAWAVEAGVTSNSVIFARHGATIAIGAGEQDRVGCVELAVYKAYTKYADRISFKETGLSLYELRQKAAGDADAKARLDDIDRRANEAKGGLSGAAMVSDGFFPFRDGVDAALAHGVSAIAQPGGSLRDHEVIMAVNEAVPQASMVFTGQRSFKH